MSRKRDLAESLSRNLKGILNMTTTPDAAPPFPNCRFRICDLPGQCVGEGRCHHPGTKPDAAAGSAEIEWLHKFIIKCSIFGPSSGRAHLILQSLSAQVEALRRELKGIRDALTGEDYASLPSDFPTIRMAHSIRSDRDKFLQQARDTCVRAERAESELSRLQAELDTRPDHTEHQAALLALSRLRAEGEAAKVDAERYRWLRVSHHQGANSPTTEGIMVVTDRPAKVPRYIGPLGWQLLDAAIDAARVAVGKVI